MQSRSPTVCIFYFFVQNVYILAIIITLNQSSNNELIESCNIFTSSVISNWYRLSTAFAAGHCYEPFVKYGNLSSSDNTWAVGTVVEFACDPGYTLEQGSVSIECIDPNNPQWNETEPACRGLCVSAWLVWMFGGSNDPFVSNS